MPAASLAERMGEDEQTSNRIRATRLVTGALQVLHQYLPMVSPVEMDGDAIENITVGAISALTRDAYEQKPVPAAPDPAADTQVMERFRDFYNEDEKRQQASESRSRLRRFHRESLWGEKGELSSQIARFSDRRLEKYLYRIAAYRLDIIEDGELVAVKARDRMKILGRIAARFMSDEQAIKRGLLPEDFDASDDTIDRNGMIAELMAQRRYVNVSAQRLAAANFFAIESIRQKRDWRTVSTRRYEMLTAELNDLRAKQANGDL